LIRFGVGANTIGSGNGSNKPRETDRAYINLQWQVYNARQELAQAQAVIQQLQRKLDDVSMLTDILQGQSNGVLIDMMSTADRMVVEHVMKMLRREGNP